MFTLVHANYSVLLCTFISQDLETLPPKKILKLVQIKHRSNFILIADCVKECFIKHFKFLKRYKFRIYLLPHIPTDYFTTNIMNSKTIEEYFFQNNQMQIWEWTHTSIDRLNEKIVLFIHRNKHAPWERKCRGSKVGCRANNR